MFEIVLAAINIFTLTQAIRDRRWLGYAIGLVSVAVSLGIRIALGDVAMKFPFVIFLPPVVVTTFVGGLGPGVAAAVLAGLVADVTLIAKPGTIVPPWPDGWLALAFYAFTVGVDIALIRAMTIAFRRAAEADAALRRANEDLETRVAERTAELRTQIVEREAAEAQIRQMQKMESVGQLTGGIAHDFNNMLAVVIGSLEMATRRIDEPERVRSFIASAEEGAKRASQLVSRLLAFSRQQPLSPRALDITALVAGMIDLLRRTIGEQIKVSTILEPDTWRCFADAAQIENALLNLAVNARDAMPDGGTLTIETVNSSLSHHFTRLHPEISPGDYVMIVVSDTGTGMTPEVIERAFDPFYTTKEVGKGTGLGLSQVYGFVKQSGGHIALHSEVGHGTSFRLYLPRHVGPEVEEEATFDGEMPRARADEIVLVVEDEPGVRHISVLALRELGYTVMQAADGRTALGMLRVEPAIRALFTDVVMPEMNGPQLVEAARALRPDLPVVFATGYSSNHVLRDDVGDRRTAVLLKPFDLTQLATKMRAVLDQVSPMPDVAQGGGGA